MSQKIKKKRGEESLENNPRQRKNKSSGAAFGHARQLHLRRGEPLEKKSRKNEAGEKPEAVENKGRTPAPRQFKERKGETLGQDSREGGNGGREARKA